MQSQFTLALEEPVGTLIWESALNEANALYHDFVGTEHVLMALSRAEGGYTERLLARLNLPPRLLRAILRARAGVGSARLYLGFAPRVTPRLTVALQRAQAALAPGTGLGEREFLLALLESGPGLAARVLAERGPTPDEMAAWVRADEGSAATRLRGPGEDRPLVSEAPGQNIQAWLAALANQPASPASQIPAREPAPVSAPALAALADCPMLTRFGRDLVAEARAGQLYEAIGRQRELLEVARALARRDRNVPVLVGEAGVGKTAIVHGLAWRLAQPRDVIPVLEGKRIIALDLSLLEAGAGVRGEFEERLQRLIGECATHPEVIIFLDEAHTLVGAGHSSHAHDAAQLLKPALASGQLKMIGATTPEEYDRYLAADAALERRMQPIRVEELTKEATLQLLEALAPRYVSDYGVRLAPEALRAAVDLSIRYLPERRLPDKALDLLDSACASFLVGDQLSARAPANEPLEPAGSDEELPEVTAAMVAEVVAERLGVPIGEVAASDQQRLLTLPHALRQHIVAQDEAVATVAEALQMARADLRESRRPRAVLFFAGPTGVGKTEMARALAEALFSGSQERRFLRLDMAEYAQEHEAARLRGAPPGYVGYEREGRLTGWLRHHPYSVVLFDEIEKAHPHVHTLLLGLFDNGEIADGQNRTVSGREAIFILTSNLIINAPDPGASQSRGLGFFVRSSQPVSADRALRQELRRTLPHEWVNRLDRVVLFRPLDSKALLRIAQLQLNQLSEQLEAQGTVLHVPEPVKEWLVARGTDPESGARELKRVIESELTGRLARLRLEGRLGAGVHVYVNIKDDQLNLRVVRRGAE